MKRPNAITTVFLRGRWRGDVEMEAETTGLKTSLLAVKADDRGSQTKETGQPLEFGSGKETVSPPRASSRMQSCWYIFHLWPPELEDNKFTLSQQPWEMDALDALGITWHFPSPKAAPSHPQIMWDLIWRGSPSATLSSFLLRSSQS